MPLYIVRDCYDGYSVAVEADTRNRAKSRGASEMSIDYIEARAVLAEHRVCPRCGKWSHFAKRDPVHSICYVCWFAEYDRDW